MNQSTPSIIRKCVIETFNYHLFSNDCYGDSGSIGLTVSPYSPDEVEIDANGVPPSLLVFNFLVSESNPYFINSKPSLTE